MRFPSRFGLGAKIMYELTLSMMSISMNDVCTRQGSFQKSDVLFYNASDYLILSNSYMMTKKSFSPHVLSFLYFISQSHHC